MNQGGEPGHDDYGLPRVDVQIPDDARELYRDVQAYHRELRAVRRQQRSQRWRAPLRKSGMIVPVIAGCLVLAMIAGMVLTMFSANPYFGGTANPGSQGQAGPSHQAGPAGIAPNSAPAGTARSPAASATSPAAPGGASPGISAAPRLPGATITVAGLPVMLRRLTRTALAMVPASCACAALVRQLVTQASKAGVTVYLVGRAGSIAELNRLAPAPARGTALLAIDKKNALWSTYQPSGLTVLLVDARGAVTVASRLGPRLAIEPRLRKLRQAG